MHSLSHDQRAVSRDQDAWCYSSRQLVSMWQVLVSDEATITHVFQHILEVLSFSLPYQEKQKGNVTVRLETEIPKSVS